MPLCLMMIIDFQKSFNIQFGLDQLFKYSEFVPAAWKLNRDQVLIVGHKNINIFLHFGE